jgi:hypothetical protein
LPSRALTIHLEDLLEDAFDLDAAHLQLRTGRPGRQYGLAALNRSAVSACISAWESYVEELVRESLTAMRPPGPALGHWPALNASARSHLGRFHNPGTDQVRKLISDTIGLADVHHCWSWPGCTPEQAAQRLNQVLDLRHRISHGVHPRPAVNNSYSSGLPGFFRRLARCTDDAVRGYLVDVLGIANPWPV